MYPKARVIELGAFLELQSVQSDWSVEVMWREWLEEKLGREAGRDEISKQELLCHAESKQHLGSVIESLNALSRRIS